MQHEASPQRNQSLRLFRLQILLALGLLIAGLIISIVIMQLRRNDDRFLAQRVALSELHVDSIAAESDIHAYRLTNNDIFVERYTETIKRIDQRYTQLNTTPLIAAALNPIQTDFSQWRAVIDNQVLPLMQNGQIAQADELTQQNSMLIQSVNERLAQVRVDMREVSARTNRQIDLLNWLQLGNIGILTMLLLSSLVTTIRSWRREFHLVDDLRSTSEQLIASNTELAATSQAQQEANERLESRIEESRLTNSINDMLAGNIMPEQAYQQITHHVGSLLDGWCSIAMRRRAPEDHLLDIVAIYHPDAQKLAVLREFIGSEPLRTDEGLHSGVFQNNDDIVMLQVPPEVKRPDALTPEQESIVDVINLTSYIAVPIRVKDEIVGLISVASSTDNYHFESSQALFLNQVADRLGTWIENNRLFFLAEKRAKELQISFDSINDLIVAYDAAGRVIRMNKTARQFWGDNHFDAFGTQTIWRTAKGTVIPNEEHPIKVALTGSPVNDVEVQLVRYDGESIVHTVSVSPISITPDVVSGAVLVARDLTMRKELDRLKEELVANMSHELRTPLTAILGYSELLLKRRADVLTPWHINKIEGIRTGGQRLLTLVNDVLDLAKLDAGRIELHRYAVDLNELLHAQADLLQPVIKDRKQHVIYQLAAAPPVAIIDPDRIGQILMNLLSNASKFTPEGGTLTLYSARMSVDDAGITTINPATFPVTPPLVGSGEYALIAIQDTGVGVAPEMTERLWDRFYQVEGGSTRRFGGTGLGLAIVQQLVELHQGRVWMQSEGENQGSIFAVLLPLGELMTEATTAIALKEKTILIIEPNHDDSLRFKRDLSEIGFDVVTTSTAKQALEWLHHHVPVAIMLNPILPDMSDDEISANLRDLPNIADTPIILTSDVIPIHTMEVLDVATYLIKPFTTETLLNTVRQFVSSELQKDGYILVVDDDVEMASLLAQTLQEHGYNTRAAYDGSAALSLLQTDVIPSLILLDLMMPIIDGFEFLRWIRHQDHTRSIPVIIITARDLTNAEIRQLLKDSQAVQMKHTLKMDALISEVQRYVPLKESDND